MKGYVRVFFTILIRFEEFLKRFAYVFVTGFGVVCAACIVLMLSLFALAAWRYGGSSGDPAKLIPFFAILAVLLAAGVACFIARRRILRAWPEVANRK